MGKLDKITAGLFALTALLTLHACVVDEYLYGYDCSDAERRDLHICLQGCHLGCLPALDAGSDADAAPDAEGDAAALILGEPCDGQCVPGKRAPFDGPVLFWVGASADPASEILACPEKAPITERWYADLQAPPADCGACFCDPPVGSCTLPTTSITSSSTCAGPASGAAHIFFDAPGGWDGTCTSQDAIPAGKICDGAPCIQSIILDPIHVTHGECAKVSTAPVGPLPPPTWGTSTLVCQGTPATGVGGCQDPETTCAPAAPPGFAQCLYLRGVTGCPSTAAPYTERHVVYQEKIDTRACAPCTCGSPIGDACAASLSIFKDGACTEPLPFTVPIDAKGPKCFDLPPGAGLGSKSATTATFLPGICQPGGGGPTGAALADPDTALTLCCLPASPP